jgi:hypothetical protein
MLSAYIQGVGILGPGIANWPGAIRVLQAEVGYVPAATLLTAPAALPPAERRRAGRMIQLALAVGDEAVTGAGADPATLASVFSSSGGDGDNCHEICAALATRERLLSPTRFHNSVHNASSGYWSIAHRCPEPSTALCAYDASFGAGLLEALSQLERSRRALLLVCYDLDYPPPMRWKRSIPDAFAIALVLSHGERLERRDIQAKGRGPAGTASSSGTTTPQKALARVSVSFTAAPATPMARSELEALRRQIPAARGLPLLERLSMRRSAAVALDYLDAQRLRVEVEA